MSRVSKNKLAHNGTSSIIKQDYNRWAKSVKEGNSRKVQNLKTFLPPPNNKNYNRELFNSGELIKALKSLAETNRNHNLNNTWIILEKNNPLFKNLRHVKNSLQGFEIGRRKIRRHNGIGLKRGGKITI